MPNACRQTDISLNPADAHGCNGCPHTVSGPALTGSGDVSIEGRASMLIKSITPDTVSGSPTSDDLELNSNHDM